MHASIPDKHSFPGALTSFLLKMRRNWVSYFAVVDPNNNITRCFAAINSLIDQP
jgi:hypothetical protein